MFIQIRPNIWLSSEDDLHLGATQEVIKKSAINRVVIVADNVAPVQIEGVSTFVCGLRSDRMNPTHIKDLACHCAKYMVQNGDKVVIVGKTGLARGAYIVTRMICELENKSIYDVFLEMQALNIEGFDIGKAYL